MQELLTPKTEATPLPGFVKQEALEYMEPLEDISRDKNRILVVPEGLDVQATFYNGDDKNNVVIIKDEKDLQMVLNYGNEDDIDGNRAIVVSDGINTKTKWCGNVGEDSYPNEEIPPYDLKFGEQSLKSNRVDHSEIRKVLAYDPNFYVRRLKTLYEAVKKLQKKKKLFNQITRRKRRKIVKLQKRLKRMKKYVLPPKCSTQPIVHVISQVVNN